MLLFRHPPGNRHTDQHIYDYNKQHFQQKSFSARFPFIYISDDLSSTCCQHTCHHDPYSAVAHLESMDFRTQITYHCHAQVTEYQKHHFGAGIFQDFPALGIIPPYLCCRNSGSSSQTNPQREVIFSLQRQQENNTCSPHPQSAKECFCNIFIYPYHNTSPLRT